MPVKRFTRRVSIGLPESADCTRSATKTRRGEEAGVGIGGEVFPREHVVPHVGANHEANLTEPFEILPQTLIEGYRGVQPESATFARKPNDAHASAQLDAEEAQGHLADPQPVGDELFQRSPLRSSHLS